VITAGESISTLSTPYNAKKCPQSLVLFKLTFC